MKKKDLISIGLILFGVILIFVSPFSITSTNWWRKFLDYGSLVAFGHAVVSVLGAVCLGMGVYNYKNRYRGER